MKFYNKSKFIFIMALILVYTTIGVCAAPEISVSDERVISSTDKEPVVQMFSDEPLVELSAALFAGGDGTKDSPYLIENATQLKNFATRVNNYGNGYESAYYKLTKNINLSNANWTPVGFYSPDTDTKHEFSGTFDGAGFTISNFNIVAPHKNSQSYTCLGFFGFVQNATLKNITLSDFTIETSEDNDPVCVGGLVGRFEATNAKTKSVIEKCHIKNAKIKLDCDYRLYGGGLLGFAIVQNANLTIKNSSADAECFFTIIDDKISNVNDDETARTRLRCGGFIGFLGSTPGETSTKAEITLDKNDSHSTLITYFSDVQKTAKNNSNTGGFVGSISLDADTNMNISKCYSTDLVYSYGYNDVYSGAFSGVINLSNKSNANISDCFTSTNVYVCSKNSEAALAGFSAVNATEHSSESVLKFKNIYTSSNIIDLGSKNLETVKTVAPIQGNVIIENCYAFEDTLHHYSGNLHQPDAEKLLKKDETTTLENYDGFDESVWQINSRKHPYPILTDNQISDEKYSVYTYLFPNELAIVPDIAFSNSDVLEVPDNAKFPQSYFEFSHWSVYPKGDDAVSGQFPVNGGLVLFPNFTDEYVSFKITFVSEKNIVSESYMKYKSEVIFPDNPKKEDDSIYSYKFSHWSTTENGLALSSSQKIVNNDQTFYAVYKAIKKEDWDGSSSLEFENGNGTEEFPYEITNAYQLCYLSERINQGNTLYNNAHYVLTRNIDLMGFEWMPIGTNENPFSGHFDGNGYSIYNFIISDAQTDVAGVFGYIKDAEISKLNAKGFTFEVINDKTVYAGGIVGHVSATSGNTSKISECTTNGTISIQSKNAYIGGIGGYLKTETAGSIIIENTYSEANISAKGETSAICGGIAAYFEASTLGVSKIDKTYFSGSVDSISDKSAYSGGITAFLLINNSIVANEVSLSADSDNAILSNSFVVASRIAASKTATTSKAGTIYAHCGQDDIGTATISNCAALRTTESSTIAKNKVEDDNITLITAKSNFYNAETSERFGFDFENIWVINSNNYPTLKAFSLVQSDFEIVQFTLNKSTGTAKIELEILYRDPSPYIVLVGVYDSNGRMIGFQSETITSPMENNKISISFSKLKDLTVCKLTVVNAKTLQFIESVKTVSV